MIRNNNIKELGGKMIGKSFELLPQSLSSLNLNLMYFFIFLLNKLENS